MLLQRYTNVVAILLQCCDIMFAINIVTTLLQLRALSGMLEVIESYRVKVLGDLEDELLNMNYRLSAKMAGY